MFEHFSGVIRSGALVPVLVLLPNLVWMLWPAKSEAAPVLAPQLLAMAENIGRAGVLVLPFFWSLDLSRRFSIPVTIAMGMTLAVYYAAWIRYFTSGADARLLYAPLLGIPLPMAVAPALFFLLSAYLMGSYPMLIAALVFGVSHIWTSALNL